MIQKSTFKTSIYFIENLQKRNSRFIVIFGFVFLFIRAGESVQDISTQIN